MAFTHDFATLAIRGGRTLDHHASSLLFPLYQTGTFVHDAVGVDKGFSYSRVSNPTVDALEKAIAALEGAKHSFCFRTGLAAETALFFTLLRPGDHVVLSEVLYGGTLRLFAEILEPFGVDASFVDSSIASNVEAAMTPQTKLVFIESPGNPILRLTDIAAVSEVAHRHGALLAVDNTFLTPVLQRPFELGADITVLSTTKYIDGHNATVGGAVSLNDGALAGRLDVIRKTLGSIQAPFEAWLTLQGLRTLPLRLWQHCENAQVVAEWLARHPAVARVHYPGLQSYPQHELAVRQQSAGGGMISFELNAPSATAIQVLNSVQLCSRAESLGGVETLITHPASTTHADVPVEERQRLGITDGLIRLSVGLESPADILADLEQAFAAAGCCAEAKEAAGEIR